MAGSVVPLKRPFYERDTEVVAFELIGKILVFRGKEGPVSGRIVETEAYLGSGDPASHAFRGPTPRNKVMFGPAGFSYVYFTYGNHHCLNFVTEKAGVPGAVLIRALEPRSGVSIMKRNRRTDDLRNLTNGPGKLTQAVGISREQSGIDLTGENFCVSAENPGAFVHIQPATRIGISRARERLLRFYEKDSLFISVL